MRRLRSSRGGEQELLEDPAEQEQQDGKVDELGDQPRKVDAERTYSLGCEDYLDHVYLPMSFDVKGKLEHVKPIMIATTRA